MVDLGRWKDYEWRDSWRCEDEVKQKHVRWGPFQTNAERTYNHSCFVSDTKSTHFPLIIYSAWVHPVCVCVWVYVCVCNPHNRNAISDLDVEMWWQLCHWEWGRAIVLIAHINRSETIAMELISVFREKVFLMFLTAHQVCFIWSNIQWKH